MAQYGKFHETILNAAGAPVSGASVSIRVQGATAEGESSGSGVSNLTIGVDAPGRFANGQTFIIYQADGLTQVSSSGGTTQFTVNNVTATQVVAASGFSGTLTVPDGARLINTSTQQLYADAEGDDTKGNPLTADANGLVFAWLEGGFYDVIISGSGLTTRVLYDVHISGQREKYATRDSATAVVRRYDTYFAIVNAGAKLWQWMVNGTEKAALFASGNLQIDGQLNADGGADIEGDVDINGALTGLTGLTVASGSVSLPAGSVASAALADEAITEEETVVTDANKFSGSTGTTAWEDVTNLSIAITPASTSSIVFVDCTVQVSESNSGQAGVRLWNDTDSTVVDEAHTLNQGTIPDASDRPQHIKLSGFETGLSGAKTYKVQVSHKSGGGADQVHVRGDLVTSRLRAWQHKK